MRVSRRTMTKRQSSPILAQMIHGGRSKTSLEQCLSWETQNHLQSQTQLNNGLVSIIDTFRLRLDFVKQSSYSLLWKRMNNGLRSKKRPIAVELH